MNSNTIVWKVCGYRRARTLKNFRKLYGQLWKTERVRGAGDSSLGAIFEMLKKNRKMLIKSLTASADIYKYVPGFPRSSFFFKLLNNPIICITGALPLPCTPYKYTPLYSFKTLFNADLTTLAYELKSSWINKL